MNNTQPNQETRIKIDGDRIEYVVCSFKKERSLIEKARTFIQDQYSKLEYVGYNADFDRMFDIDGSSRYFIAINAKEEILATSRVVTKGRSGLPIEYGLFCGNHAKVILEGNKIAEMNSFAAAALKPGNKVLSMSTDYTLEQDFETIYGLFDIERPTIGKLYNRFGAVLSEKLQDPIYFPGYGKLIQNKIVPAKWRIMVSDKSRMIARKRPM
ncbi:hypothetical protein LEP1GSC052_2062 [Leptospira kmetyi serovar Malaysia str. Bejo-Iso9]|nr:hypothetical protein [Leptospira kmetyi]EQA55153.1 hypothetical protein LEP1GSC052_2062 [Leptospira kmetyi serovar Malaysia str. Bejo-Iso9]